MMRRSAVAVLVLLLHIVCHCFLAVVLMYLTRDDFNGLYWWDWFNMGSIAAFFASVSARSFPLISVCPGIHIISN